ncbi:MAG: phosphodiester glycosidase family protein [Gemmatimonadaceae bacterium]
MRTVLLAASALLLAPAPRSSGSAPSGVRRAAAADSLPRSDLSVRLDSGWVEFWRSERAPDRWDAPHPAVARALAWRSVADGVDAAELALAGTGEAWRMRAVVVRLDPSCVRLRLVTGAPTWRVEEAPDSAVLALNAGQFAGSVPWGWVVRAGVERRAPGRGPLAAALVVDTAGRVRWLRDDGVPAARASGAVAEAFQSYPTLLAGGEVPEALRADGRGVSVAHRDSRLAACALRDGRVLFLLTRFDAFGDPFSSVPFGPTAPETAALMGALGCLDAVMLDGGISGQLLLREASGERRVWRGWRRVPLGLVVYAR